MLASTRLWIVDIFPGIRSWLARINLWRSFYFQEVEFTDINPGGWNFASVLSLLSATEINEIDKSLIIFRDLWSHNERIESRNTWKTWHYFQRNICSFHIVSVFHFILENKFQLERETVHFSIYSIPQYTSMLFILFQHLFVAIPLWTLCIYRVVIYIKLDHTCIYRKYIVVGQATRSPL